MNLFSFLFKTEKLLCFSWKHRDANEGKEPMNQRQFCTLKAAVLIIKQVRLFTRRVLLQHRHKEQATAIKILSHYCYSPKHYSRKPLQIQEF